VRKGYGVEEETDAAMIASSSSSVWGAAKKPRAQKCKAEADLERE